MGTKNADNSFARLGLASIFVSLPKANPGKKNEPLRVAAAQQAWAAFCCLRGLGGQ
jgi:hypothetical protein